jgi:GNAT superfamily N-acetyltransferase
MQRVRRSVRENQLVSLVISDDEYAEAIEDTGRGWIVDVAGDIVGFAVGNGRTGNIWALFVDPDHEGRGYGRVLHDAMIEWLWSQDLKRLWLTTAPGTRAERFYVRAGWQRNGRTSDGEVIFERFAPGSRRPVPVTDVEP